MYERCGEQQPAADLVRYRESLATILHEQAHFLGPAGATQEAARGAFTRPGGRQLEEGVAEAWAQDHLNDFLSRVGVDKVAPGINDVKNVGYYPAYVPAVRILTTELENRAGLNRGEVLEALNRQTAEGQLPLVVGLLYDTTRLPELETAAEGAEVRGRLEAVLRDGLPKLDAFEFLPPGFAAARSRSTTGVLLDRLKTELTTAESHHFPHPTACALPHPTASTLPHPTAGALPHPTAGALPHRTAGALPHPTAGVLPHPTAGVMPDPAVPAPTTTRLIPSAHHVALSGLAPPTHLPGSGASSGARSTDHRAAAPRTLAR